MTKNKTINVKGIPVTIFRSGGEDFISLTDIARNKNPFEPKDVVKNWMRSKTTIEFLGIWEQLNNPDFKGVEFDSFMYLAGTNAFTLSPLKWIEATNAKGLIYELCHKHGNQIEAALERMRGKHDRPFKQRSNRSFLETISNKDYLKPPVELLVREICNKLKKSLPIAFENGNNPKDEGALNSVIHAIIEKDSETYNREYPTVRFALANAVPYDSLNDLLIEAKYLRGKTTPSKATEGIAADLTKYLADKQKLFIVYDPGRSISDDEQFITDFQAKGNCTVTIVR